jgi:hypothetical protein
MVDGSIVFVSLQDWKVEKVQGKNALCCRQLNVYILI